MALFRTNEALGRKPAHTRAGGGDYSKVIAYTPEANLAIGDVVELCKLEPGEQVIDWQVANTATALAGSLGVLNPAKTALTDTWKAGIAAYQRADSAASWANLAERAAGFLVTTAQTGAGTITVVLHCRMV